MRQVLLGMTHNARWSECKGDWKGVGNNCCAVGWAGWPMRHWGEEVAIGDPVRYSIAAFPLVPTN